MPMTPKKHKTGGKKTKAGKKLRQNKGGGKAKNATGQSKGEKLLETLAEQNCKPLSTDAQNKNQDLPETLVEEICKPSEDAPVNTIHLGKTTINLPRLSSFAGFAETVAQATCDGLAVVLTSRKRPDEGYDHDVDLAFLALTPMPPLGSLETCIVRLQELADIGADKEAYWHDDGCLRCPKSGGEESVSTDKSRGDGS